MQPVMDHLTRFSGITPEDLDPSASRHHLLAQRTVYLKLRHLIDRGVTLVGHGLKKDFRIINVFVPPAQVGGWGGVLGGSGCVVLMVGFNPITNR